MNVPFTKQDKGVNIKWLSKHICMCICCVWHVSALNEICAQSWGHKEAFGTLREQPKYAHNSPFPELESNESPCILSTSTVKVLLSCSDYNETDNKLI